MAETPRREKVVDAIIEILRTAGKPEPVSRTTTIGDLTDVILPMINSKFFPPGKGFQDGEIDPDESVAQLATEVIQLQDSST